MRQAWLGWTSPHAALAEEAWTELALALRLLVPVIARRSLQELFTQGLEAWQAELASPERGEDLQAANAWLNRQFEHSERGLACLREEACTNVLRPVERWLDELQQQALLELDDRARLAWELGAVLQQGACPPHVHRFMYQAEREATPEPSSQPPSLQEVIRASAGMPRLPEREREYLANKACEPGEGPPTVAWAKQVLSLWAELGLPVPPDPWSRPPHEIIKVNVLQLVAVLNEAVQALLRQEQERLAALVAPLDTAEEAHAEQPNNLDQGPWRSRASVLVSPEQGGQQQGASTLSLLGALAELVPSVASDLKRIADRLDPPPANIVGSRYVADCLGQTTTWVAQMVRDGTIPKACLVPGTGNGKVWKFYRSRIDEWLESR